LSEAEGFTMADPQTPSTIFGDIPQSDAGTNDAMPRFGGRTNPGERVHVEIDGKEHIIESDDNELWDFSSPELANGDHEFEMWTENAAGDRSDSVEWETDVQASENDRREQRERNEQWDESGRPAWQQENDPAAATGAGGGSAGGGGSQGRPLVPPTAIPNPGGGGRPPGTGGAGGIGVAGVEKGNQPGARVMG